MIKIAQRLRPFSHLPGISFVIPKTSLRAKIFPARILLHDLAFAEPRLVADLPLRVTGPVEKFTVEQDLEKGAIRVWGHTQKGFMRYQLQATSKGVELQVEKAPPEGILESGKELFFECSAVSLESEMEMLSLGGHKGQDWELIRRRQQMEEILPFWHRLGQMVSSASVTEVQTGTGSLLLRVKEAIAAGDRLHVLERFRELFLAGLEGGLCPRLQDNDYQGFDLTEGVEGSPLQLLVQGFQEIRKLFIQITPQGVRILPVLPPSFHCGRMLQVRCKEWGDLDLEWSKKSPRRLIFTARTTGDLLWTFPKEVVRYRLRLENKERGVICKTNDPFPIQAGQRYTLDRFER